MSDRDIRKQALRQIIEQRKTLTKQHEDTGALLTALRLVQEQLELDPPQVTLTDVVLEYIPQAVSSIEVGHCAECGGQVYGWDSKWKAMPCCGSKIRKVTREDSPHARVNRELVDSILSPRTRRA